MNHITIDIGKKQGISDTRLSIAFEKAFHEPPVFIKHVDTTATIQTQLDMQEKRLKLLGRCLNMRLRSFSDHTAFIK